MTCQAQNDHNLTCLEYYKGIIQIIQQASMQNQPVAG